MAYILDTLFFNTKLKVANINLLLLNGIPSYEPQAKQNILNPSNFICVVNSTLPWHYVWQKCIQFGIYRCLVRFFGNFQLMAPFFPMFIMSGLIVLCQGLISCFVLCYDVFAHNIDLHVHKISYWKFIG